MASKEQKKALARKEARKLEVAVVSLKNLRTSARKARVLADLVRGRTLNDAYVTLAFQKRFAAAPLRALLKSAAANAADRGFDADHLVVEEIQVHKGPIAKRFMPRAQGRASPIRKQSTHIDIRLSAKGGE